MRRRLALPARSSFASFAFVTFSALSLTLSPAVAHATDTQTCLAASDKGQRARAAGKLREAQKQLAICAADGCPGIVRHDCIQWQSEVSGITPTVVFGAKDRAGRDLFDVSVTMDGEPLVKTLDGKAVSVDPGPHLLLFETAGQPGVTERVLVKEGEKARVVNVIIGPEVVAPPPPARTQDPQAPHPHDETTEERHHTVLPWVVVGIGGAAFVTGIIVFLTAPSLPANCNSNTNVCVPTNGESASGLAQDQRNAQNHDGNRSLGLILGGVGLGVLAGGLIWHFVEPTGPRTDKVTVQVAPWRTANSSGLSVLGTF